MTTKVYSRITSFSRRTRQESPPTRLPPEFGTVGRTACEVRVAAGQNGSWRRSPVAPKGVGMSLAARQRRTVPMPTPVSR